MDGREPERPEFPAQVGPYRIEEQLGSGGMGEVYRAYDERLRRWVAIKQLVSEVADYTGLRQRFRREARAVASLNHQAIVQVYDILEGVEGHDWIVMELVEGTVLKEMIADGPLAPDQAIRLAGELVEGLAVAHSRGIVHRDLKTENVMVTSTGQAKILDFGLAKDYESAGTDSSTLSSQGAVIGTVRSMSPEQVMGLSVDPRSDLFSLGTLLFETLTGESPFKAANSILTLARVCSHRQPPISELNPNVPEALSELVDHLLEKEPDDRPESAREVASVLKRIGGNGGSRPSLPELPSGPSKKKTWDAKSLESTDGFYIKTLLQLALVDRAKLSERLGASRAAEVLTLHDRLIRDLLAHFGGLEVEKGAGGFLLIFERPVDAVGYAISYHDRLRGLSEEMEVGIEGRTAIHLGEVHLHENPAADVARGAKHLEVEGSSKLVAARLLELARPRQTLVTREAFELAQRAHEELAISDPALEWLSYGTFRLQGVEERVPVFEVGREGVAPLVRPRRPGGLRRWLALAAVLALAVTAVLFNWYGSSRRTSVAVLGFQNLSNQDADLWLSTTLAELLSTELAVSGELLLIPGEAVARMKRELQISETESLASDTLKTIGQNLGTDYVVLGSYLALEGKVHFAPVLQSTKSGETIRTLKEDDVAAEIVQLVSRVGEDLRDVLGASRLSELQIAAVRATLPESPDASRLYSEGLMKLRSYDALGARDSLDKAVQADPGFALAYAALSEAWADLGYDEEAQGNANLAYELSQGLPREHKLLIEARSYEISRRWQEAISIYHALWSFFPDDLEYGLRLADVQTKAGDLVAAAQTVETLRDLGPSARQDARIDMAQVAIARQAVDYSAALDAASQAAEKAKRRNATILMADALRNQGWALRQLGENALAGEALKKARRLFGEAGDRSREAQVLNALSSLRTSEGRIADAEDLGQQALVIHRETGNRPWTLGTLNNLAILLKLKGDYRESARYFEEAMDIAEELGEEKMLFDVVSGLVALRSLQGDLDQAQELMETIRGQPTTRPELLPWRHLADVQLALTAGELKQAEQALRQAFAAAAEFELPSLSGELNFFAARQALAAGQVSAAEEASREAVRIHAELEEPPYLARAELVRAQVEIALGGLTSAKARLLRIRSDLERCELAVELVEADAALAEVLWLTEGTDAASAALARATAAAASIENPAIRLSTQVLAARMASAEDPEAAREELTGVLESAREIGLVAIVLEARLALAELPATSREDLAALVEDARRLGYGLIERRAEAILNGRGQGGEPGI